MDEFLAENWAAFGCVLGLFAVKISAPPFIGKGGKSCLQNDPSKMAKFGLFLARWPNLVAWLGGQVKGGS